MKENNEKVSEAENRSRVKALFEKLPWLEKHHEADEIDKISFTKLDRKVLEISCGFTLGYSDFECYEPCGFKRIIRLFSEKGALLTQVGIKPVPRHSWSVFRLFGSAQKTIWFEETVVEALRRVRTKPREWGENVIPIPPAYIIGAYDNRMILTPIYAGWEEQYLAELKREEQKVRESASAWLEQEFEMAKKS